MVVAPSFDRAEADALNALNAGATARRDRLACDADRHVQADERGLSRRLRDGAFLPLARDAGARACSRLLDRDRLARRDRSAARGVHRTRSADAPDFIDGHQHVHLFPQVREALLDVVKDVGAAGLGAAMRPRPTPLRAAIARPQGAAARRAERAASARAPRSAASRTNPAFAGTYDFASRQNADFATLFPAFLAGLAGGERGDVPSRASSMPSLQRLDPLTTQREREYAYLAGDAFPGAAASARRGAG